MIKKWATSRNCAASKKIRSSNRNSKWITCALHALRLKVNYVCHYGMISTTSTCQWSLFMSKVKIMLQQQQRNERKSSPSDVMNQRECKMYRVNFLRRQKRLLIERKYNRVCLALNYLPNCLWVCYWQYITINRRESTSSLGLFIRHFPYFLSSSPTTTLMKKIQVLLRREIIFHACKNLLLLYII
jgi:hypothetical protein